MRYLIILTLYSALLWGAKKDSLVIFDYPEQTTVAINEDFNSNKLNSIFDAYSAGLILVRTSDSGDITLSCKRRLNVKTCTFVFLQSPNVKIDKKTTKVYSDDDNSLDLIISGNLMLDFQSADGNVFFLEITPNYFAATSRKK